MRAFSLDGVLKILYMYKVRVRGDSLIVDGGERFPTHVRSAILTYKPELLKIYGEYTDLMATIDAMEKKALKAEGELFEDALDLWNRYFMLNDSLKFYLPKPWVIVPEDEKRCSFCPHLGEPAREGVLCDSKCQKPY